MRPGEARIKNLALRVLAAAVAGVAGGAWLLFLVVVWIQPFTSAATLATISGGLVVSSLTSIWTFYVLGGKSFRQDGHTYCGHCGYILKGLTEPRCSECGQAI